MNHLTSDNLDIAVFTSEMVADKLQEITALQVDHTKISLLGNSAVKEAANQAYNSQLDVLCGELGELALTLPVNQITSEADELKDVTSRPDIEVKNAAQSVRELGAKLKALIHFATADIADQVDAVTSNIKPKSRPELSDEEKERLTKLVKVEEVLNTPITSDTAANRLLNYFATHEGEDYPDVVYAKQPKPLATQELVRQMVGISPRERLIEYFSAFQGYPIEITDLADVVYLHDSRDKYSKHTVMSVTLNPKQSSGKVTNRDLAEKGLVIQYGWLTIPSDSPRGSTKRKKVARSLQARNYSSNTHVGSFIDGSQEYVWEPIDTSIISEATK